MGTQIVIHQNTLKIPPDLFNGIGTWCDLSQKSLYDNVGSFDVLQPKNNFVNWGKKNTAFHPNILAIPSFER